MTVAVVSDDEKLSETIQESDIKVEWYSGTGAGGQHRNKHQNSCRMTHIPTNTTVTSQCRSRQNSYEEAYKNLCDRVDSINQTTYNKGIAIDRKNQVGSGMRGDKIRTYRFQDDTVKDHNTGSTAKCTKVLNGYFDLLWK